MKLVRVSIISAKTCGGLLDGLDLILRDAASGATSFAPLCLVGPNGTGKSQFLQLLAEIFQCIFHACLPAEERLDRSRSLQFEIEYLIVGPDKKTTHVRVTRRLDNRKRLSLNIDRREGEQWLACDPRKQETHALLPTKVVGYSSGQNETLSHPFLVSRSGYATDVRERAFDSPQAGQRISDTRLMLIDYGTHLEVLVSNLLLGSPEQRDALLSDARLKELHSFRCIVQLHHQAAPDAPRGAKSKRKGVQLTKELEQYIENMKSCATCYEYDEKEERYVFDYWINDASRTAFRKFWSSTLDLYGAFHKLAMLNDLALSRSVREQFERQTKSSGFASHLPEPQDEDKIFRFESVRFRANMGEQPVDYVALSDGEHQLAQILGTLCMVSFPGVLFLLDEPESHFNPQWRVKFVSRVLDLPTDHGRRSGDDGASNQECLMTTHAPFVPSDMPRRQVWIFSKKDGRVAATNPQIETFGTTFDTILDECFGVRPPISGVSRDEIERLKKSNSVAEVRAGLGKLGQSVEKVFVADHLRQIVKQGN